MIDRPKRVFRELSPEERERWLQAVAEEERAMPETSRQSRQSLAAIEEQSLSGELRRAIIAGMRAGNPIRQLAEQANVPFETLNAFMGGSVTLDSNQISRIAALLECHLVSSD